MIRVISAEHLSREAIEDLWRGLKLHEAWSLLALHELRQRFRRSTLGPLWITVSMGILVGTLGLISSTLFNRAPSETLPHIATGVIMWGLLVSCVTGGSTTFILREVYIRNIPLPISVHLYEMLMRNLMIWGFNMLIFVCLQVIVGPTLGWYSLLFLLALPLFILNVAWMALMAGILSTRYRDIPEVISSLTQVLFFLTPVFWSIQDLPSRPAFVTLNPLFYMLEIVREPLLGNRPPLTSWVACIAMAAFGWAATLYLYRRAYARIAYWV